jgi:hypothetical protein
MIWKLAALAKFWILLVPDQSFDLATEIELAATSDSTNNYDIRQLALGSLPFGKV